MKQVCFLLLYCCIASTCFSQNSLKTVIPPSPASREFDKYINYDVELYNGIPKISIPIYNIQVGNTIIPITLNYHASGIKFKQINGEVGVGWVLEPGYRISRTINGRPDELTSMPKNFENIAERYMDSRDKDTLLSTFVRMNEFDIPITTTRNDGEFDFFTYYLPSESGKFVIEDRINKKIRQISHSNLSIEYNPSGSYYSIQFVLKDGNGMRYNVGTNGNIEQTMNIDSPRFRQQVGFYLT
ncbi:MAG: hypothetical protein QM727_00665 [Niabella sp.]